MTRDVDFFTIDRGAGGDRARGFGLALNVFNDPRVTGLAQIETWRLLLLPTAHFGGMAWQKAIEPCRESRGRIHPRA
jgi:hypothetical protein